MCFRGGRKSYMDRIYKATRRKISYGKGSFLIAAAVMIVLSVFSILNTYEAVMENAKVMGDELIKSYVADEERNISIYKTITQMGLTYIDNIQSDEYTDEEKENLIDEFFEQAKITSNNDKLECFAVFGGKIFSSEKYEKIEKQQERVENWYRKIPDMSTGTVVFSNKHMGSFSGEGVLSVYTISPKTGNVFVVDLTEDTFEEMHSDTELL